MGLWLNRIRRGFNRTPRELKLRVLQETKALLDRYRVSPIFGIDDTRFLRKFGCETMEVLWQQLSDRPYPALTEASQANKIETVLPGEFIRIKATAEKAMSLEVDLLGSGPVKLNSPIAWHADFKSGFEWPVKFFRDIDILNPDQESDVKVPWELSRLQWLIPVGQAHLVEPDERYAEFARDILVDWINNNPYGQGVNWAIAMEAAMRLYSWTWFFHVFKGSDAWEGYEFRQSFLRSLFEHAIFCERYLEDYGLNGNHCTADAGALVFAGLFFGEGKEAHHWAALGWEILEREMPRQILDDGTDFEGAIAYHRFVAEMFFWPSRYRRICGEKVSEGYLTLLQKMADFTRCYTRPDASAPFVGDNDDGRVLPFGLQDVNDHSYLPKMIYSDQEIDRENVVSEESLAEIFWAGLPTVYAHSDIDQSTSRAFAPSGNYIMATEKDHIFIDGGSVGYSGRGGHGHNDCLAFEAYLNGVALLSDSGTFVYTWSYQQRNDFRSTAAHNTPMIDGEEQNRFINDAELFALHYDAKPNILEWQSNEDRDVFYGSHAGYQRLDQPVTPLRKIILDKKQHWLIVKDEFDGKGDHDVTIPYHFTPGCDLKQLEANLWLIKTPLKSFNLVFNNGEDWRVGIRGGWFSPSYGVKIERSVIEFKRNGSLKPLNVGFFPEDQMPASFEALVKGVC